MRTPIFFTGSATTNLNTGADRYSTFAAGGSNYTGFATVTSGAVGCAVRAPMAGTISQLRVRFPTPITVGTYTVTLMKGATQNTMTNTVLAAVISPGSIDAVNLSTSITVAEGEYLAWRYTPAGGPEAQTASIQIACVFDSAVTGRSPIFANLSATSVLGYAALGVGMGGGNPESVATSVFPIGGTITKMYASLNAGTGAPGTGNGRTFTLRIGNAVGALAATPMTVTFGETEIEKTIDLTGSPVTVTAGTFASVEVAIAGAPASSFVKLAFEFIPTTSGLSPHWGNVASAMSTTLTRYVPVSGGPAAGESTENNVAQIIPAALTIKSILFNVNTAPGDTKNRIVTFRRGAGGSTTLTDTALTTTLTGAGVTSATAASDVAMTAGDTATWSHATSGTPTISTWTNFASVVQMSAPTTWVEGTALRNAANVTATFGSLASGSSRVMGGAAVTAGYVKADSTTATAVTAPVKGPTPPPIGTGTVTFTLTQTRTGYTTRVDTFTLDVTV